MWQIRAPGYARVIALAFALVAGGVVAFLLQSRGTQTGVQTRTKAAPDATPNGLFVYCAAGLKPPIERIAIKYRTEEKADVALQYGGTATLLTQLRLAGMGDVFIAADQGTLEEARKIGVVEEVIPLVRQRPVLAVRAGNPLGLHKLEDLYRAGVKVAIANVESASIGKLTRIIFKDEWERFSRQIAVTKPTVTEIASDLSLGAVDAAILWNSTVPHFKNIETVDVPALTAFEDVVSAAVLTHSKNPTAALAFARFLAAPEKGGTVFSEQGFDYIRGDSWVLHPDLTVYSGGVNRLAIETLLKQFEKREGAKITTVFNGCGVLCAAMKTLEQQGNAMPDAYYACDVSFLPPVANHFQDSLVLTETRVGILVKKGNPRNIRTVADLAQNGLRVGLCNAQQSTLGYLTVNILKASKVNDAVRKNVVVEVPTADFLVNQMRVDGLDACVVYAVNAAPQAKHLDFIPIDHPGAMALQPFSINVQSPRRQLTERLLEYFKAHRDEFEKVGFNWRGDGKPLKSSDITVPDWVKESQ